MKGKGGEGLGRWKGRNRSK